MGRNEFRLTGTTYQLKTGCGAIYVTINEDGQGKLVEMLVNMGKAGGCAASQTESIGRLISVALRNGVNPQELIKQLSGISCHSAIIGAGQRQVLSCADAIAQALKEHVEGQQDLFSDQKIAAMAA